MKFLVDAHLPRRLAHQLRAFGHEAVHTLDLPRGNRTPDPVGAAGRVPGSMVFDALTAANNPAIPCHEGEYQPPMSTITTDIVAKLWNLCNVLKDDGVTYHQYVTELTYLLLNS
jgi:hypothetical protein